MAIARITDQKYATTVTAAGFTITADGTSKSGIGGRTAMRPQDLLDASLASCIAMTVRMAVDVRGTAVDSIEVDVHRAPVGKKTEFICELTITGDLTDKERAGLLRVAHHCPITKILERPTTITITETPQT